MEVLSYDLLKKLKNYNFVSMNRTGCIYLPNVKKLRPNNQKEFAQFCYGNMASCKDGDVEQCLKNAPRHINM